MQSLEGTCISMEAIFFMSTGIMNSSDLDELAAICLVIVKSSKDSQTSTHFTEPIYVEETQMCF